MPLPLRLSISEAAKFFGVQPITIRRAIKEGKISYVVVRGRYKLNFESLLRWSQERPHIQAKMNSSGIGQYVDTWKIKNKLYSPNPEILQKRENKNE